jgi:hypothetical protein
MQVTRVGGGAKGQLRQINKFVKLIKLIIKICIFSVVFINFLVACYSNRMQVTRIGGGAKEWGQFCAKLINLLNKQNHH